MKTSAPDVQFVTSLKNRRLGIFRSNSTRTQLVSVLAGDRKVWQTEYPSVGIGSLEMFFDHTQDTLQRVNIKFSIWEGIHSWQKVLNLTWLDWLSSQSFDSIFAALDRAEMPFRVIEFEDGCRGILRDQLPATVMLLFDTVGTLELLILDFRNPFGNLVLMRTLKSFHM